MLRKHCLHGTCSTNGAPFSGCRSGIAPGRECISVSVKMCVGTCVYKGELCVGWEWGTLVSQLLCVSLPTADPRAVNPASMPARVNTL